MMHPQIHPEQMRISYPNRGRVFNVGSSNFPPNRNGNPHYNAQPLPPRNKVVYPVYVRHQMPTCPPSVPKQNVKPFSNPLPPPRRVRETSSVENHQKTNFTTSETTHDTHPNEVTDPSRDGHIIASTADMIANDKLKTPMCMVNELARFNKISHQYRLTGESGPAHKKKFTVTLKLGNEEYSAEGASIKKAQHIAAADAMQKTKYSHPPPKVKSTQIKTNKKNTGNITPTVELNAFAMKQGLNVTYEQLNDNIIIEEPIETVTQTDPNNLKSFSDPRSERFNSATSKSEAIQRITADNNTYKVSLKVGFRTFVGIGTTPQAARHNAASRALEVMRSATTENDDENMNSSSKAATVNDLKSPISMVHEIALRRKLPVTFEVKQEKGPPHMKIFVTLCKVGDIATEGEGNGKKLSRKKAAENMLEELRRLGPVPTSSNENSQFKNKKKITSVKKKNRNLIKENTNENAADDLNPISHLIQLSQSRKEKEPVYTLIEEKGAPRRREFIIEVDFNGVKAIGNGCNKKVAKRFAAIALLKKLGILNETEDKVERVQSDNKQVRKNTAFNSENKDTEAEIVTTKKPVEESKLCENNEAPQSSNASSVVKPKQQLLYLAQLLDFQVAFSDFPKGNHGEYLTLVTLSTFPPQVCHGSGPTMEESNDQASMKALSLLRELGLDIVKKPGSC